VSIVPAVDGHLDRDELPHEAVLRETEEELDEMGIGEDDRYTPAIIGYAYITRCIYTEDADGRIPDYIQRWEAADDLDVVSVGREISFEEMEKESLEDAGEKAAEEAESDD